MKTWLTTWFGLMAAGSATAVTPVPTDLFAIPVTTIDGDASTLAAYKGKTLLVVNVASKCGYTKQYPGIEALYAKYKDRGLVVLGFPSNDFLWQEPGTDKEIKTFCKSKYDISFPMFAKAPVKGAARQPVFEYLVANAPDHGAVKWNFEKFVVDPAGKVTARFGSGTTPDDAKLVAAVEAALPKDTPK